MYCMQVVIYGRIGWVILIKRKRAGKGCWSPCVMKGKLSKEKAKVDRSGGIKIEMKEEIMSSRMHRCGKAG